MADTDVPPAISSVINKIHVRQRDVVANNWIATQVGQHLKEYILNKRCKYFEDATFELVGSAAENLVTSHKDDKDLLMVLGPPYTPQYFQAVYRTHGMYFLKWNKNKWNGTKPHFVRDKDDILNIRALRLVIQSCIQEALKTLQMSDFKVKEVFLWKQTVRIVLYDVKAKNKHFIDVLPQIQGDTWGKTEGVVALADMGAELQQVVLNLEASGKSAIQFSLFGPVFTPEETCIANFSVLERDFFLRNNGLREMVLIGKLILGQHRWKERYGIKAAHLKRLAMANMAHLNKLTVWRGGRTLLKLLQNQLQSGEVDGFPNLECDLLWEKPEEACCEMSKALASLMLTFDPNMFENYL